MDQTLPADRSFPRGALLGAGTLIAFAILAAATARLTSTGPVRPGGAPIVQRDLRFEDKADGSVVVLDAANGQSVDVLAPGTNGFIRASLRSLANRRKLNNDHDQTWHLAAWPGGRLTLDDQESGGVIDLEAFGPTNAAAFARLLTAPKTAQ